MATQGTPLFENRTPVELTRELIHSLEDAAGLEVDAGRGDSVFSTYLHALTMSLHTNGGYVAVRRVITGQLSDITGESRPYLVINRVGEVDTASAAPAGGLKPGDIYVTLAVKKGGKEGRGDYFDSRFKIRAANPGEKDVPMAWADLRGHHIGMGLEDIEAFIHLDDEVQGGICVRWFVRYLLFEAGQINALVPPNFRPSATQWSLVVSAFETLAREYAERAMRRQAASWNSTPEPWDSHRDRRTQSPEIQSEDDIDVLRRTLQEQSDRIDDLTNLCVAMRADIDHLQTQAPQASTGTARNGAE